MGCVLCQRSGPAGTTLLETVQPHNAHEPGTGPCPELTPSPRTVGTLGWTRRGQGHSVGGTWSPALRHGQLHAPHRATNTHQPQDSPRSPAEPQGSPGHWGQGDRAPQWGSWNLCDLEPHFLPSSCLFWGTGHPALGRRGFPVPSAVHLGPRHQDLVGSEVGASGLGAC